MSVRPLSFNSDGSNTFIADETGHLGNLQFADIQFGTTPDGATDFKTMNIKCPDNCGDSSSHPIIDGANAEQIQELFVRLAVKLGCPCHNLTANKPISIAIAHAKTHTTTAKWRAGVIK